MSCDSWPGGFDRYTEPRNVHITLANKPARQRKSRRLAAFNTQYIKAPLRRRSQPSLASGCHEMAVPILLHLSFVMGTHQAPGCLKLFDEIASVGRSLGGFELLKFPQRLRPMAFAPIMRSAFLFPDGISPLADPIIPITTH